MKNQLERIEDYANSLERVVLNDEEQMLLTVYNGLNTNYKKILIEEAKLLFELQGK